MIPRVYLVQLPREKYTGWGENGWFCRGMRWSLCCGELYLDSVNAESVYARELDGFDLVILDSLPASAPDVDENSSEVRRLLDVLGRVSEKTGVVSLVIHHARKPHEDAVGGAKMSVRGSGAIFDACSSLFVFSAEKGQPTLVQHEKARTSGTPPEDFLLTVDDITIDGDPRGGFRMYTMQAGEVTDPTDPRARIKEAVVALARDSRRGKGRGETIDRILDDLIDSDEIVDLGTASRRRLYVRGTDPKH